jgi:Protein of unknown function (DUF2892)
LNFASVAFFGNHGINRSWPEPTRRGSLTNGIVITMFGRIPFPDRLQRIFLGACLMALTFLGLLESMDWKKWTALVLQTELLFTGLAGWCPIYWACRVGPHTNNKKSKKSPEIEQ